MRNAQRSIESRALATRLTMGPLLGAGLWALKRTGRVRVFGRERAIKAAREGKLLIAANHPTGAETFIVPGVFCPEYYADERLFVWSMPKKGLVPWWMHKFLRCIEIERGNPKRILLQALPLAEQVLTHGGVILTHPENGRTINGKEFVEYNGRRMRCIKSRVTELASKTGASILPLWIDVPNVTEDMKFWHSIGHLYANGPMSLYFGDPYHVGDPFDLETENKILEKKILSA